MQELASISHRQGEFDTHTESQASLSAQFGETSNIKQRATLQQDAAMVRDLIKQLDASSTDGIADGSRWGTYDGWVKNLEKRHQALSLEPSKGKIQVVKRIKQLHDQQHRHVKETVAKLQKGVTDILVTLKEKVIQNMDRTQLLGTLIVNKVCLDAQATQGGLPKLQAHARILSPKQLASGFGDSGLPRLADLAFRGMVKPSETFKTEAARILMPQLVNDPKANNSPVLSCSADVQDGMTMQRCSKPRLNVNSGIVAKSSHLEISFVCCPMCQSESGAILTFSPSGCSVQHKSGANCEIHPQLESMCIKETSLDPQSYSADDRQKLLDEQAKYRFAEAVGGMSTVGILDFCTGDYTDIRGDIRGLAEAIISICGKQMAKLDCGGDVVCMIGDARNLWCMHQPKKRAMAGSDSGFPVPAGLIETVKTALGDEFHRAQAPFNARDRKAMQDVVTTFILAHAGQPNLSTVRVDGFQIDSPNGADDLLAEVDSDTRWGNASPLDRAAHFTGGQEDMTRSIDASLSKTGVTHVSAIRRPLLSKSCGRWYLSKTQQHTCCIPIRSGPWQ